MSKFKVSSIIEEIEELLLNKMGRSSWQLDTWTHNLQLSS